MKDFFIFYLLLLSTCTVFAQEIYVSSSSDDLYLLDISNCTYEFVVSVDSPVFDMSFHPDGTVYGISGDGELYTIDILTGATTVVHDFNGQIFNSLIVDANGIIYTTGNFGNLWSYDPLSGTATFHGSFGFEATGDLTFYEGNLYAAISGDRILLVDIDNPSNSSVIIDENFAGDIFGIVTFAEDCDDVRTYAITNGNSEIYEIDFETNTLTPICGLDIEITGGGSAFEFLASMSISIEEIIEEDISCGTNTGSITIIVSGGTGQILYSIDGINFQTSNEFANLAAGNYTITVIDENGCMDMEDVEILFEDTPDITGIASSNTTCGDDNGSITITASGGTGQLEYSVNGGTFQTSTVFDNLGTGNYTITVRDENGCTDMGSAEVFPEDSPTITNVSSVDNTCGDDNGSITVTASGGAGQLEYSVDGFNFQTSNVFNNFPSGNYTVTVRDENNCTDTGDAEILTGDSPGITNVSSVNAACGSNNGSITIMAGGGTGLLEYSVDGINFQTSNFFDNLAVNSYTITVRDENGCTVTDSAQIFPEDTPSISSVTTNNTTCGNDNGSITITANGGTGQLEYSIDGFFFQTGNVFDNLTVSSYTVTVRDENGCTDTGSAQLFPEDSPTITDIVTVDNSCGLSNGSITISTIDGTGQLEYSIDGINFQTSTVFDDLPVGDYTITVRDENDCTDTGNAEISPEASPSITDVIISNATCGNDNGSITVIAGGGMGELAYSINGIDFQSSNAFDNLAANNYTITVRDENDCADTENAGILPEDSPSITDVAAANATCENDNGSVTILVDGGTGQLEYSIDGMTFQTSNVFANLPVGNYTTTVRDENDCTDTGNAEILPEGSPNLTGLSSTNTTCGNDNGSITITASGGTGDLEYSIDGVNFQTSNTFADLPAGDYTTTVRDENDCMDTGNTEILPEDSPSVTGVDFNNTSCGNDNGSITITASGGTGDLEYSIDGINFQTGTIFENLSEGNYTATVRDENLCTDLENIEILPEDSPDITGVPSVNTTCGNNNGSITVLVDGGTGQLEYSINGLDFQTTPIFEDLTVGNYTVTVRDENDCTDTGSAEILPEDSPSITGLTSVGNTCGDDNGSITVTATGGTGPLEYSIDGATFQPSGVFDNVPMGDYTVTVRDQNNCTDTGNTEIFPEDSPSITGVAAVHATCGNDNGSVTISVTGGIGQIDYSIDGTNFQAGTVFENLPAGNYTVTVRDDNECTDSESIEILPENAPDIAVISSVNATCGNDSGSVTVTVNGGTGPLEYSVDGIDFQLSNVFDNLPAGSYTITVRDENDCMVTASTEIVAEDSPSIADVSAINTTCGDDNGSISITVNDGTGELEYSIDGINFQMGNSFETLPVGSYTVTVRDENDCTVTGNAEILPEDSPEITGVFSVSTTCGNDNGSITITISGGTGELEYSIDGINFQMGNSFDNLPVGSYTVTVRDENDCTVTENAEILPEDLPVIMELSSVNTTCGNDNGSITILANGGVGQLEYSINGGTFQTSNVFDDLPTGNYTVTIRDENECTDTGSAEVLPEDSPSITGVAAVNATCGDGNGSITVTASGGTGQSEYSIDGVVFQASAIFDGLPAGSYTVTVRDENDCTDTGNIEILPEDSPEITEVSSVNTTCGNDNGSITITVNGGTGQVEYSVDGIDFQLGNVFANLSAGNYTVTVRDENDCTGTENIEILQEELPEITDLSAVNTTCGNDNGSITITAGGGTGQLRYSIDGINFQALNNFENLPAGNYHIVIQDANGCQDTQAIILEAIELLEHTIVVTPTSCGEANGSIIIEANVNSGGLEYSINGNDFQQTAFFADLPAGSYTLSIRDENDCLLTDEFVVASSSELAADLIGGVPAMCGKDNGSFLIEITGGTGVVQVALNGDAFQPGFSFTDLSPGEYEVQIADEVGCIIDTSFAVAEEECPIYIPNVISPNNDGINDVFRIYPHPDFRGEFNLLRIYDRWGGNVFEVRNFNPVYTEWDGTDRGQLVGLGVYVYYMEYITVNGDYKLVKGEITVVR